MAKKRRKRTGPVKADEGSAEDRAAQRGIRRERARREREERMRRVRRQALLRRATKWGVLVLVVGGIAAFVYVQGAEDRRLAQRAAALAGRLGCTEVEELADDGNQHLESGEAPPEYATSPAASGRHASAPLASEPHVYTQPVPELQAIHNLEHGYIRIHYREEGEDALPDDVVAALAEVAEDNSKVIMAPYPDLEEGVSLALVGWTRLQTCPSLTSVDDAASLAEAFLQVGSDDAPEPGAP